jgi:uncharacterized protein (DUF58 family)
MILSKLIPKIIPHAKLSLSLAELVALRSPAKAIDLLAKRKVFTDRAGGHLSGFKGRGIDFDQARAYQPGDDIRLMDWRVTARSGKPHTKIFHQERERPVFLLIDQGPHMFFGTKVTFKSIIAAKAAALIAWAAVHNGDRVGAIIFAGQKHIELRPQSRKQGVLPLLKLLTETSQPQPLTSDTNDFASALLRLRRVARPGSLVFLISDFSHCTAEIKPHLARLAQQTETIACFVSDPLERVPPPPGYYTVSDGEKTTVTLDTTGTQLVEQYQARFTQRFNHVRETLYSQGIPLLQLSTDQDVTTVFR